MKKIIALVGMFGFMLSACMPAVAQTQDTNPTPISDEVLQATAALLVQQTLDAFPTQTVAPSNTPVITTPTHTATLATPTETQNPVLLTLTATLGTGTVTPGTEASNTLPTTGTGTPQNPSTTNTPNPLTPTAVPQPQFVGTLPPALPSSLVILTNKADVDVYISLRCETSKGNVTILEYPVKKYVDVEAPVGSYTYVAWVGGRQFTGAFLLVQGDVLKIDFFKNRISIN